MSLHNLQKLDLDCLFTKILGFVDRPEFLGFGGTFVVYHS